MKAVGLGVLLIVVALLYLYLIRELSGALFLIVVGVSVILSKNEEDLWA